MPSMDAYVGWKRTDQNELNRFLLAHRLRHQIYADASGVQGVAYGIHLLTQQPDDQWFLRHAQSHMVLTPYMVPDNSVSVTALMNASWNTDSDFDDWIQMHRLIHQRIDQYFGIFS